MEALVFALWIISGEVSGANLTQPRIEAYFTTAAECQRVGEMVSQLSKKADRNGNSRFECIQAKYWLPSSPK